MVRNLPKHVPKFGYDVLSRNLRLQRQTKTNFSEELPQRTLRRNYPHGAGN